MGRMKQGVSYFHGHADEHTGGACLCVCVCVCAGASARLTFLAHVRQRSRLVEAFE